MNNFALHWRSFPANCPQQRHWDLLPIFRASTGISGTSGTAKASSAGLPDGAGSFGREVWQQVYHHLSVTLLNFLPLMDVRHHGSCYRLRSHLGSAGTCQFILSGHVPLDWNSKCSWHTAKYFHYKVHRVYNIFSFKRNHTHSLERFKILLSLVTEFRKLYLKSFDILCSTEYKTYLATF